jgi:hypothetical protein
MAVVLAIALLLGPLRRKAGIADAALALCIPGAAFITFLVEKGLPSLPPEQKWLILPWTFVLAGVLGLVATAISGRRHPGAMAVLGAAVVGCAGGLWLALPGIDTVDARISLALELGIAVLVLAAVMRQGRPVLTCVALWGAATALSLTLASSANITLAMAAGAIAVTVAVAGVLLSIAPGSAPKQRLGVGAAIACATTLVMLMIVGRIYDIPDGIASWRWCLAICGPAVLLLVPFATTLGRKSIAFIGVLLPAAAAAWPAVRELMDMNPAGF